MSETWSVTPPSPSEQPPPPTGATRDVSLSKQRLVAALVMALLVTLAAGAIGFFIGRGTATESPSELAAEGSRLPAAYESCSASDADDTMSLADEGSTIVVNTMSEYGSTAGMECVLEALGTPESIRAQIGRTTAMMGVQDGENDGIEYSWSFHPDNGVDMVITDTRAGQTD